MAIWAEARCLATCLTPAESTALTSLAVARIAVEATPFFRRGGRARRVQALQAMWRSMAA
eukprot:CAMPEP_0170341220 /NCGR_PEP_ID=MMETSP0116_2-20130129/71731_1 /TAXON_ID=400756 /ORGANISM="Durinskia baltica, Strain CSIRO CS-38" /LENGTH=59 /DNA_ID=CAMNT_0010594765 /DNA_START=28 /DNA_END=204 /DNA_ORIENTATION=+